MAEADQRNFGRQTEQAAMADEPARRTDPGARRKGILGAIATAVAEVTIVSLTSVGKTIADWTGFQIAKSVIVDLKVYLNERETKGGSDFSV